MSRCQNQTLCHKQWEITANCQTDVSLKNPGWKGNDRRDFHWPFVLSTSWIHTARNTNNPLLPMSEVRTRQFQLPFESVMQTLLRRALCRQLQRQSAYQVCQLQRKQRNWFSWLPNFYWTGTNSLWCARSTSTCFQQPCVKKWRLTLVSPSCRLICAAWRIIVKLH